MSEEQIKHLRIELFNCTENILNVVKPHVCESKFNEVYAEVVTSYWEVCTALNNCIDMDCEVSK